MQSVGAMKCFDEGSFWSLSFEQAVKASHLAEFFVDFSRYVIKEKVFPYFGDEDEREDILTLLNYEESAHQLNCIDHFKFVLQWDEDPEELKKIFGVALDFWEMGINFSKIILGDFNVQLLFGFIQDFRLSAADSKFNTYFTDAANWCLSPELQDLFNNFVRIYPYHDLDAGINIRKKKHDGQNGSCYSFFNDILLFGVMERVVAGKVDLSSEALKSLIRSILSCPRILLLKDFNKDEAKSLVNNLLALADKTNESEVWKGLIFSVLISNGCEELQILCCNYGRYASSMSERVSNYNKMLDNFENWWDKNFVSDENKKRIAAMADYVDDNVFVACKCDEEFMWFDFKFLDANGLFKISTSLYKRYIDIFSCVTDKRFIVVFILELLNNKLIGFVPSGDCKKLKNSFNIELGNNPIKRLLCKED